MTVKKETTPVVKLEKKKDPEKKDNSKEGPKGKPEEKVASGDNTKPKQPEHVEETHGSTNPIENLIQFIKEDQELLETANENIEKAKTEKRDITDRLKDSRRDVATLYKYATPDQKALLDELGFDMEQSSHGLNSVAQTALDILAKSKKQLTNEELYNEYVASLGVGEEPVNYTQFNIKLRSPLNTQLIVKKVVDDGQGSRTDLIYLNGGSSYK